MDQLADALMEHAQGAPSANKLIEALRGAGGEIVYNLEGALKVCKRQLGRDLSLGEERWVVDAYFNMQTELRLQQVAKQLGIEDAL